MTRFDNLVLLKSQRSHLDSPGYLLGYIIIKVGRAVPLGGYGFTSGTKQERWIYDSKCVNLEIFNGFDNWVQKKLQVNSNLENYGLRYYKDKIGISVLTL